MLRLPDMTWLAPTQRKIAVDNNPIDCRTLSYDITIKLLRKIFFETERNSFNIASRKTVSAEAAFTASIPLIASI